MVRASLVIVLVSVVCVTACGRSGSQSSLPFGPQGGTQNVLVTTKDTTRIPGQDEVVDAAGAAAATFAATSDSTRPPAVILADKGDWQGQIASAELSTPPVSPPILLSDHGTVPQVTQQTIDLLNPGGLPAAGGAQIIRVASAANTPPPRKTFAVGTGDQYQRAADLDHFSQALHGRPSGNVIVASGDQAQWAMPAAAWAARSGDTVLFTKSDSLPDPTKAAIQAHGHPNIFILGPESVISASAQRQLQALGNVTRVQGPSAVENSVAFARFSSGPFGWAATVPGFNFTLARTNRPGDVAAAATFGANGVFAPTLLTDGSALPQPVESYLLDVQPGYRDDPSRGVYNHVWILGDEGTIARNTQGRLDEISQLVPVRVTAPRPGAPAQH